MNAREQAAFRVGIETARQIALTAALTFEVRDDGGETRQRAAAAALQGLAEGLSVAFLASPPEQSPWPACFARSPRIRLTAARRLALTAAAPTTGSAPFLHATFTTRVSHVWLPKGDAVTHAPKHRPIEMRLASLSATRKPASSLQ